MHVSVISEECSFVVELLCLVAHISLYLSLFSFAAVLPLFLPLPAYQSK
jgi:hypothetical protein